MNNNIPINRLEPTDTIIPEILTGSHYIPLKINQDALPPEKVSTIDEILASLQYDEAPAWMRQFPEAVIIETRSIFKKVRPFFDDTDVFYQFSITRRLDEKTFVGNPIELKLPILKILVEDSVLLDKTGESFIKILRAFVQNDLSVEEAFQIQEVEQEYIGDSLNRHTPELFLVETWNLISAYKELSVGVPAGSVTVIPKEERIITINKSASTTTTVKESLSVIEKVSVATTTLFQKDFTELKKISGSNTTDFTWSSSSKKPGTKSLPAIDRSTTGKRALTINESLDTTLKTVHSVTSVQNHSRDITVTHDYQNVDTATQTLDRKVTIKNETDQCITYTYHYLDTIHQLCVDLVEVVLMYTGETVDSELQFIPLTSRLNEILISSVLNDPSHLNEVRSTIDSILRERYQTLGIFEESTNGLVLKAKLKDDVNTKIHSRQALFGERRSNGPLPVNIGTTQLAVQTPNLHVVPNIAQFSLPPKKCNESESEES